MTNFNHTILTNAKTRKRTKLHYLMLIDMFLEFLDYKDISYNDFDKFMRDNYTPNETLLNKAVNLIEFSREVF